MTRTILVLWLLVTIVAMPLMASGPSSSSSSTNDPGFGSFSTVDSRRCDLLEIRAEERVLRVFDKVTRKEVLVVIDERTVIRAQKKSSFDGRRRLEFADLAIGQELIVTTDTQSGQVSAIRIRG
ncbi:MAG: hypothetical protein OEV00_08180 [Acidobacteriota bacterium]|nr:hypothetical protein [Acidobacteriota bacterium]MDH3785289.1 hypothetical protein [Acidobacteriota bacterium]